MARGRYYSPQRETGKRLRVNEQIRTSPIRLIDENNEQIGVIEIDDAKRRAKEAGLDLVEVSGKSTPPVCRIMDYGKWKYQQKKKEQKARSHSKQSEQKEVRLRPKTDDHDLDIKIDRARRFIEDGHKVQFTMQFRGREMAHRELGFKSLKRISDKLSDVSKLETAPRMAAGRRMTMVLAPDRAGSKPPKKAEPSKNASTTQGSGPPLTPVKPPASSPSSAPSQETAPSATSSVS